MTDKLKRFTSTLETNGNENYRQLKFKYIFKSQNIAFLLKLGSYYSSTNKLKRFKRHTFAIEELEKITIYPLLVAALQTFGED